MTYKYSLDSSSKKFICPKCQKKALVRYKDNELGNYLGNTFGRCDRESKCQYHKKPNGNTSIITNSFEPIKEIHYLQDEVLGRFANKTKLYDNNFFYSLAHIFNSDQLIDVLYKFAIGICNHWQGATIFWQIDNHFRVRTGKLMLYDKNTGKRVKDPYPHIQWMHKILGIKNFSLEQCLFGLHQVIDLKGNEVINLVESEKTAVIMSLLYPNYVWMATGSKNGFKEKMLDPIKKFKLNAFPDKTEYDIWNQKADHLNIAGFDIKCSDLLEKINLDEGADLVDYLLL